MTKNKRTESWLRTAELGYRTGKVSLTEASRLMYPNLAYGWLAQLVRVPA